MRSYVPCSFFHNMPSVHISWNPITTRSLLQRQEFQNNSERCSGAQLIEWKYAMYLCNDIPLPAIGLAPPERKGVKVRLVRKQLHQLLIYQFQGLYKI